MSIKLDPSLKYALLGNNRSGKSVAFRWVVKKFRDAGHRVLVYDVENEWAETPQKQHRDGEQPPTIPGLTVYKPRDIQSLEEFNRTAEWCYNRGNMILAVESMDLYANPKKPLPSSLADIVHRGRNRKVGLVHTSRLPADVHKTLLGLSEGIFLFRVYEPNAVKYLKQIVGPVAEELAALNVGEFYYYTGGKAVKMNPVEEVTF